MVDSPNLVDLVTVVGAGRLVPVVPVGEGWRLVTSALIVGAGEGQPRPQAVMREGHWALVTAVAPAAVVDVAAAPAVPTVRRDLCTTTHGCSKTPAWTVTGHSIGPLSGVRPCSLQQEAWVAPSGS